MDERAKQSEVPVKFCKGKCCAFIAGKCCQVTAAKGDCLWTKRDIEIAMKQGF